MKQRPSKPATPASSKHKQKKPPFPGWAPKRVPKDMTRVVIVGFLEALDCPRSLAVWLMYHYGEHDQLLDLECRESDYKDSASFRDSYVATEFLSKADFLNVVVDRKEAALNKFRVTESACAQTNRTIKSPLLTGRAAELVFSLSRKIELILGEFDVDEFLRCSNWGPGATTALKRCAVSNEIKFAREGGITRDLHDLLGGVFTAAYPAWDTFRFEKQPGGKITTVPKNAKTDRTILIEPGLNLWFQKGVGAMIRRRLKRVGIDLDHGSEWHGVLARRGSLTGYLCTVDFSSASDLIARELVRALLPDTWYRVMNCLRSKYAYIEGSDACKSHKAYFELEKFSSMGNGFTFELETLIFYALAVISSGRSGVDEVSVFGDDVIIPSDSFDSFKEDAELLGFALNVKKSHATGAFRESCGQHFHGGLNCKPFYLKGEVRYDTKGPKKAKVLARFLSITRTHNKVVRLAARFGFTHRDSRFAALATRLRSCWPVAYGRQPLISDGYGDGGFVCNFDEATPPMIRGGHEGYSATSIVELQDHDEAQDRGVLLARLWPGDAEPVQTGWAQRLYPIDPRSVRSHAEKLAHARKVARTIDIERGNSTLVKKVRCKLKSIKVLQWSDLGGWCN